MKKVILILGLCLLFSCTKHPNYKEEIESIHKYKVGEVVFINNEAYQIDMYWDDDTYYVIKLDCRSADWQACRFKFLESEISKYKK